MYEHIFISLTFLLAGLIAGLVIGLSKNRKHKWRLTTDIMALITALTSVSEMMTSFEDTLKRLRNALEVMKSEQLKNGKVSISESSWNVLQKRYVGGMFRTAQDIPTRIRKTLGILTRRYGNG